VKQFTILHTIETGGPGGAESILLCLAAGINHGRFRSLALLPCAGWLSEQLDRRGVPVIVSRSNAWYDLRLPREMARFIRHEKVDLIHSHLADQNFYSCLAGRITGRKTVVTYHGMPGFPGSGEHRGALKLRLVKEWADAVVVVSDYLKKALISLGFPADRITRIHNGVDIGRFSASKLGQLRAELGCGSETKLVGMVANLRESKGYEYFVRAARKVVDENPQVKFVAVGEIDKAIGERMRQLVQQMSLQNHFMFLGFREDVPAILGDLDVFVLSSLSEGFSLATVEAMAAGRPVIATRSGGPQEIIDDGTTGILVPPADADALARKICGLLGNPKLADQLARSGLAKAASTFSIEKMVSDYETVYNNLLNGR
jgi:glycosyltransferase involved in cell wall biosynthesis